MHPLDAARPHRAARAARRASACATSRSAAATCAPRGSAITDNAIIPLKERIVDRRYDPLAKLVRGSGLSRAGRRRRRRRAAPTVQVASVRMEAKHDVLVVGGGCAGMRAAIEAFDTGADVAIVSRSSIRRGATPARRRAASTPRSATPPRTAPRSTPTTRSRAPTTSATRTRSRSSARRRRATSTSSSTGARSSRGRPTGASRSVRSARPAQPRTAYAADITGHVLIQVLYEQSDAARASRLRGVLRLEARRRRRPLPGRDRLGPASTAGSKAIGAKTVILATGGPGAALRRDDERLRVHRRRDGDGPSRRRSARGHGDDAVPSRRRSPPTAC